MNSADNRRNSTATRVTSTRLWLVRRLRTFGHDTRGAIAIVGALALPVLALGAGAVIDYGTASRDRIVMQAAVDSAAIAAARDLALGQLTDRRLNEVVSGFALRQLEAHDLNANNAISARIVNANRSVEVRLTRPMRSAFLGLWSNQLPDIAVTATATVVGNQKICVVALDTASSETIYMKSNAWLTAQDCNVYSNSKSASGVKTDSGIKVTAKMVCSGGGYSGAGQFVARKVTDCPPVLPPLRLGPSPLRGLA